MNVAVEDYRDKDLERVQSILAAAFVTSPLHIAAFGAESDRLVRALVPPRSRRAPRPPRPHRRRARAPGTGRGQRADGAIRRISRAKPDRRLSRNRQSRERAVLREIRL